MKQQILDEYIKEGAIKIAEGMLERDDYIEKSILLYLARGDLSPIHEIENIFVRYLSSEEEIVSKINELATMKLIEIYHGRVVTNGTTIVRLTDLGKEVRRILESDEMNHCYPTIKRILDIMIYNRLNEKNPSLGLNVNDLTDSEKKQNNDIKSKISMDNVTRELSSIYMLL